MEKRTALVTCVQRYMGEAIKNKFEALGLEVIAGNDPITSQEDC